MAELTNDIFYRVGFELTLDNAKGLSKVADKAAGEDRFGIGTSLKILAAEEAIKAVSYLLIHFNGEAKTIGLASFFKRHKNKHDLLKEAPIFIQAIIDIKSTDFGILDYLAESLEKIPEPHKKAVEEFKKIFFDQSGWIPEVKHTATRINQSKLWWSAADENKNKGLYVGPIDGNWETPNDITKDQYLEAQGNTDPLIENIDKLFDILQELSFRKNKNGTNISA